MKVLKNKDVQYIAAPETIEETQTQIQEEVNIKNEEITEQQNQKLRDKIE